MQALLTCLRAAAEPTRLRLLALCAEGEVTVSELTRILGQSQPGISRHLKLLCDAGLLDRFREGSRVFYRVADDGLAEGSTARQLVAMLPREEFQLADDRARLSEIKQERAITAEQYFQENAPHWDSVRSLYIDESEVEAALLKVLPDQIGDLLDIGTGTGRILQLLAPRLKRGVGIDTSHDMLAVARARLEADETRHCHVRHGDMYRLPFSEPAFDAVVFHQVLHYAQDPSAAIAEAARTLRPGGTCLIIDFAPHDIEELRIDHAHNRLGFADEEIQRWCHAAGLENPASINLPGNPLTVSLWTATAPGDDEVNTGHSADFVKNTNNPSPEKEEFDHG